MHINGNNEQQNVKGYHRATANSEEGTYVPLEHKIYSVMLGVYTLKECSLRFWEQMFPLHTYKIIIHYNNYINRNCIILLLTYCSMAHNSIKYDNDIIQTTSNGSLTTKGKKNKTRTKNILVISVSQEADL